MMDFASTELGPKMLACTDRERKFVWIYVHDPAIKPTDAARLAGFSDPGGESSAIRVRTHELMHSERVLDAIEEVAKQAVRGLVVPALRAVTTLIESPKHRDHAKTALSLLSRAGIGENLNVNVQGEVAVNHTDAALEALSMLKAFGASREKLVEHFGHTGLARYERMLAEKTPKQIEGEVAK
jgi:phage terminase small subunit